MFYYNDERYIFFVANYIFIWNIKNLIQIKPDKISIKFISLLCNNKM